jgi:DNA polymerase I-like protein with 3'-5' exonuclease and polymerase domains
MSTKASKAAPVVTIDFETKKIEQRPAYPPQPVGVSIKLPEDRNPKYYAWGHPTKNNCTRAEAQKILHKAWDRPENKLFHHAKFDMDVAETHMGCRALDWDQFDDTMFLLFLHDPHAMSLGLKPAAATWLNMPPEEKDIVVEWLKKNSGIKLQKGEKWGAYISEAPGDIVGRYANGDVVRTERLYKFLYPIIDSQGMVQAYDRERKLQAIFLESERVGLRIAMGKLSEDIKIYRNAMATVEKWLRKRLGDSELNLDADADVAERLDTQGIVTDWVLTKTGRKSVSKKNMTKELFHDEKVFYALGYRNRLKTCLSMFMEPWLLEAETTGGHIHPNWNQVRQPKGDNDTKGTRTGRPSCDNPNLLNLSKSFYDRGDNYEHPKFLKTLPELPLVRRYALPDKGCVWLHRDYNQQELRILAHFEDGSILKAYNDNPELDIHTFVQDEITRLRGTKPDRVTVKTLNFGKIYGQGLGSLAEKLNTDVNSVKTIRDAQNKALPGLKVLEDAIKANAKNGNPIVTWGGRIYYAEEPEYVEKFNRIMSFEYKLLNYLVQGSAADITKEAIIRFYYHHKRDEAWRFLVTVYDEINICVPKADTKEAMKLLKECMESVELDVPMLSDGKSGISWGDLTKYKEGA